MMPEEFGPFLTTLRKNEKMTQTQLAQKLNVSTAAVSKWERAICLPEVSKFEDIAKVFNLSLMEVMQCQIGSRENITQNEVDSVLETSIDIAKNEKEQLKKRFVQAMLCIVSGLIICNIGIWINQKHSSSEIIGQADAMTNIYIPSQGPNVIFVFMLVLGAILVLSGGFVFIKLLRKNARKSK